MQRSRRASEQAKFCDNALFPLMAAGTQLAQDNAKPLSRADRDLLLGAAKKVQWGERRLPGRRCDQCMGCGLLGTAGVEAHRTRWASSPFLTPSTQAA